MRVDEMREKLKWLNDDHLVKLFILHNGSPVVVVVDENLKLQEILIEDTISEEEDDDY